MPVGYWCPVLHAHLPYVRHPEHPEFLEEDWFFEALNETYVPIVSVLDGLLADGVEYRLTMTLSPPLVSMITDAHPRPSAGVHAPIASPGGIVFFGRDMESSRQVWSAETGYPGDYDYREFYKDVGWELPVDYLGEILPDGLRKNVGLKYYRVTGKVGLGDKQPYVRAWAMEKAASHAGNFLFNRQRQVEHRAGALGRPPIVVSPYDAELFGHWWFEGPDFLNYLFR